MRIIKFKGKDIEGVWRFGSLITDDVPIIGKQSIIVENRVNYIVDPNTVGQFAEYQDKNEKEIYDKDIIRVNKLGWRGGEDFKNYIVSWNSLYGKWVMYSNMDDYRNGAIISSFHGTSSHHIEVIGNIHDNPELLKEDKQKD